MEFLSFWRRLFLFIFVYSAAEKITYISVEHPRIDFYDSKYVNNITILARRVGRSNPVYYFSLGGRVMFTLDENVHIDFYFYEWLTNSYKRGFIELHFNFCEFLRKDPIFGAAVRRSLQNRTCPFPPDYYNLANMTIAPEAIPRGFPFVKGRIYANVSLISPKYVIGSGHVDMEIRQINAENKHLLEMGY